MDSNLNENMEDPDSVEPFDDSTDEIVDETPLSELYENALSPSESSGDNAPSPSEIAIGLTPSGVIGINVRDSEGNIASHFIDDPAEAWQLAGHFLSLATMMVQAKYAMAFQEQRMMEDLMKKHQLYVPGQ